MGYFRGRRPVGYDGVGVTSKTVRQLLPEVMQEITDAVQDRPDLILAAWPEIIGSQLAGMTEALAFQQGVLTVRVKNATLYSLLSQREKGKILTNLRKQFPKTTFTNIRFRRG